MKTKFQINKYITVVFMIVIYSLCTTSCKKDLTPDAPLTTAPSTTLFTSDATATSAVVGMYTTLSLAGNVNSFIPAISNATGNSSDELFDFGGNNNPFFNYTLSPLNTTLANYNAWVNCYKVLFNANTCIEGLANATALTPTTKNQLLGEAYFIRAYLYFNLINLYGDVPLVLSSDYNQNVALPRALVATVYQQIISDLKNAESLLVITYPSAEKARPNKLTAATLLAKVYLYTQQYALAETEATLVIQGSYTLGTLSNAFLRSSMEVIWQLIPVNPSVLNSWDGYYYIPVTVPKTCLNTTFFNSFELGDNRKTSWVGTFIYNGNTYYYPYKYKAASNSTALTEANVIFRLAEVYLIRAEARIQQQTNLSGAASDINLIRNRAGLANLSTTITGSQSAMIIAVAQERKSELFAEGGNRWFDLKRTGQADAVLSTLKPTTYKATAKLWPIPNSEILADPQLAQNPGYN